MLNLIMEPMNPTAGKCDYQVYMLRLWRERPDNTNEAGVWRFSLESPATHHRRGFESLEALAAFLSNQMEREPQRDKAIKDKGNSDGSE